MQKIILNHLVSRRQAKWWVAADWKTDLQEILTEIYSFDQKSEIVVPETMSEMTIEMIRCKDTKMTTQLMREALQEVVDEMDGKTTTTKSAPSTPPTKPEPVEEVEILEQGEVETA
jgi:hypothetical protein